MYITSKYLGPSDTRGSRYKATIDQGASFKYQATVHYDHALDPEGNAIEAIKALIKKADLNEYGIWNTFIVSYGPHGYVAIPSGRGIEHRTNNMEATHESH